MMKKRYMLPLIGLAVFVGLVAITPDKSPNESKNSVPAEKVEVVEVKAVELAKSFNDNEVSAMAKYGDKNLRVSGKVDNITLDFADDPVVNLEGLNVLQSAAINGLSKEFAGGLKKGDPITVDCSALTEVVGKPMLDDCSVVE